MKIALKLACVLLFFLEVTIPGPERLHTKVINSKAIRTTANAERSSDRNDVLITLADHPVDPSHVTVAIPLRGCAGGSSRIQWTVKPAIALTRNLARVPVDRVALNDPERVLLNQPVSLACASADRP